MKLCGASTTLFDFTTYDISGFKNAAIDYRSFILRAGNKFHVDLGYVVGFSFSQFNEPFEFYGNVREFKQTSMNMSAGLAVNLPITRKLRFNAAYSLGLLRISESLYQYEFYIGDDVSINRSTSIDYGFDFDLSKNLSLGLSLSKIKYNDALDEIAFRSLRFSYFF